MYSRDASLLRKNYLLTNLGIYGDIIMTSLAGKHIQAARVDVHTHTKEYLRTYLEMAMKALVF